MEQALTLLSFGPRGWGDEIAFGVLVTAGLAVATLPFGLLAGFLIALAKQSRQPSLRLSAEIYTTIFRGLPELLTLFLIYYGLQGLADEFLRLTGAGAKIEINSFIAGMIALGMVFSAYASETFAAAFRAIPAGQYEGGYALGLGRTQTMARIVLPQLVRIALPGLCNLWMILLKETALVSVIGLPDILRQTGIAGRISKEAFLFYGLACLLFLALAILSSFAIRAIERRVEPARA